MAVDASGSEGFVFYLLLTEYYFRIKTAVFSCQQARNSGDLSNNAMYEIQMRCEGKRSCKVTVKAAELGGLVSQCSGKLHFTIFQPNRIMFL